MLLARGRADEAVRALAEAARLLPARREPIYLARALRRAGRDDEARRALATFIDRPMHAYFEPEPEFPGVRAEALREYIEILNTLQLDSGPYTAEYRALRGPRPSASVPGTYRSPS